LFVCFFSANGSFLRSGMGCNTNETVGANLYTDSRFQLGSSGNAQNHLPSRFWKYTRAQLRGPNKRGNRGRVFLGFSCQPPRSYAKSPKEVGLNSRATISLSPRKQSCCVSFPEVKSSHYILLAGLDRSVCKPTSSLAECGVISVSFSLSLRDLSF
jgi:hypothetical protein